MPKPLGVIDQLSPEQQDELFELLNTFTIKEVLEKITAPAPDGWGLKTHSTSLHRFYHRRQTQLLREELAEQVADGALEPADFIEDAARALFQKTLCNCLAPGADGKNQKQAFKQLMALEKLALERERLKLAREKLELDKAKQLTRALSISIKMSESMDDLERAKMIKAVNSNLEASVSLFTIPGEKAPKYTVPPEKTHSRANNFPPAQNAHRTRP